jgi:CheY-like chemotaxis protein
VGPWSANGAFVAAILVVDNEDVVVRVIRASLEQLGHSLTEARSGPEAFQRAAQINHIDLIVVNHQIGPDLGRSIAEHLLLTHPKMKVMRALDGPASILNQPGA